MLQVAKLLHSRGFHITFVNTESNHNRLLKSWGATAAPTLPPGFNFETFPDGLPLSDDMDISQVVQLVCDSILNNWLAPFRDLVLRLNNKDDDVSPRVSCIVSDISMVFTLDVAKELGIPDALFSAMNACATLAYLSSHRLLERGLVPLKDSSYITNGYLETIVDCIPGLNKNVRLKDLPTPVVRITDRNDTVFNFALKKIKRISEASSVVFNTFEPLEQEALTYLSSLCPNLLTIGPLNSLLPRIITEDKLKNINTNLWEEHPESVKWLDSQEPSSVLYVNFGSTTMVTADQLAEFAWGLAKSEKPFLWIIRPNLVFGNSSVPLSFVEETKGRGMLAGWCDQERVLKHPAIGGFLSHMGWNSTIESLSNGIPMICWPYFGDHPTICFYACREWKVGLEIESEVKSEVVEKLVREVMEGEKGKEMKRKAMEWKVKVDEATQPGGSSFQNFDRFIGVLLQNKNN
uniref:UDP-glycosyltransferase 1 n=1 Tax=Linum usitatissimum TaxID=4006 RepID=I2BHA6_LINUS|nr:UDP-glycosyltransferase 1 [Linum usitatissimum]